MSIYFVYHTSPIYQRPKDRTDEFVGFKWFSSNVEILVVKVTRYNAQTSININPLSKHCLWLCETISIHTITNNYSRSDYLLLLSDLTFLSYDKINKENLAVFKCNWFNVSVLFIRWHIVDITHLHVYVVSLLVILMGTGVFEGEDGGSGCGACNQSSLSIDKSLPGPTL